MTCGDLRGTTAATRGVQEAAGIRHLSRRQEGSPVAVRTRRREGFEQELEDQRFVVMPDGSEGRAFRTWMESNGYFPKGTPWDESVVEVARALMGRRKKVAAPAKPVAKKPKAPAAAAPKPKPAPPPPPKRRRSPRRRLRRSQSSRRNSRTSSTTTGACAWWRRRPTLSGSCATR